MAQTENDRVYTEEHEWLLADASEKDLVILGITDYAQEKLGDIVMVELPEVGDKVAQNEPFGTLESPKSVSDVFAPVTGEIVAINESLEDAPETVNDDPYHEGWLVRIRLDAGVSLDGLMDAAAYQAFVEAEES